MAARLTTYIVVAIVAATLIAGLIVGAQRDDSEGPVDLIVQNAKVYTADARGTFAEAVAVRGNQILRVGSNREINRLRRPQTTVIDAHGGTVLPGFNDAHVHFIDGGLALSALDLTQASTLEDLQQRIRDWAEANPEAPWITGRGWSFQAFPEDGPTRQMLDAAVPDRPAAILSFDGHSVWVNTKALRAAGLGRQTMDPDHGTIAREIRTGEPTGLLKESAIALVARRVPAPTRADRARALRAAIQAAERHGITSVQSVGSAPEDFELFDEARRAGDLRVRVYSSLEIDSRLRDDDLARIDALIRKYPDDPIFKAGGVHIALDGSIETEAAAMLEPYASGDPSPEPWIAPDDLNRMVRLLDARGWQVLIDANGDRAVRMSLDALEHAVRSNPAPARGRRHRIEHADTVDPADVPKFAAAGAIASMQPFHGTPGPASTSLWSRNVGPERTALGWACKSLARKRGSLALGSDWPAANLDPLLTLHMAVNRTTPDGLPEEGWLPSERLPLKRAIDATTAEAAWASFDEQRKGTLATGMLADLVVLADDIFSAPPASLASAHVAFTIFDGKIVYRRDARQFTH